MKVDPSGRTAQPASRCEDPGPTGKGKGKGKTKNDGGLKGDGKTKKPPNYSAKAHGKVKLGRSTLTDAKYWIRTIQGDQKIEDPNKRKVHLSGSLYLGGGGGE